MDSMRSLNKSLPSSRSRQSQAPELLQAFKSAALSVTNLYKTAVTDQGNTRQLGYQDALEDLLAFLDKENVGAQDGEGRKIKHWATARIEGVDTTENAMESDEDRAETEKRARRSSSSSQPQTSHEEVAMRDQPTTEHPAQPTEPAPVASRKEESGSPVLDQAPVFTFCAAQPLPNRDVTTHAPETSASNHQPFNSTSVETSASPTSNPVRVEVLNRNTRLQNRHASNRHNTRNSTRDAGLISGTKRKFHLPEFFDISNIGHPRDGLSGGGKRGRYT